MTQIEAELTAFTEAEIEKRVAHIKEYADEIILHYEFNDEKEKRGYPKRAGSNRPTGRSPKWNKFVQN